MPSTHYTVKSTSYTASNGHVIKEKHTSAGNETWNALGKSTEASSYTYIYTGSVIRLLPYTSKMWNCITVGFSVAPFVHIFSVSWNPVHWCLSLYMNIITAVTSEGSVAAWATSSQQPNPSQRSEGSICRRWWECVRGPSSVFGECLPSEPATPTGPISSRASHSRKSERPPPLWG